MITVSVMAAGKTGDRIYMGSLKPFLPQFFIEFFPDPGDQRRRMKVKMYLPEIQFISVHKKSSLVFWICTQCSFSYNTILSQRGFFQ
jgi:hypothetical protein